MSNGFIPPNAAHYTVKQISQMYGYSISSLKNSFTRTAASIREKFGVDIVKCKDADGIYYRIEFLRAVTIYDEMKEELYLPLDTIQMDDITAFIVIAAAAMPQGIFRGTVKQLLDYLGLSVTKKNIELVNIVIDKFIQDEEAAPIKCERDQKSIIIYIKDNFEEKLVLTINMLRECRRIIEETKKQDIKVIQLLRVWEAYRLNCYNGVNPLTDKWLAAQTGLSIYQIGENKKLLEKNGLIKLEKVGTLDNRIGTYFDLDGIKDQANIVVKK